MKYLEALELLHQSIQPDSYVEIGVSEGLSFNLADCRSIGIDPSPRINSVKGKNKSLYRETSDDFFSKNNLTELLNGPFDLAFLDGMHLVEYALRDFMNLENHSHMGSYIIIDDILPEKLEWTKRYREGREWTGDVYKLIYILKKYRPELEIDVFKVDLKGLAIITNLNKNSSILQSSYDEIVSDIEKDEYTVKNVECLMDSFKPNRCKELAQWISKKENDLVKRKYLDLLQSTLTNEIYADNDLRIVYLMECLQKKRKYKFEELHNISKNLPNEYHQMLGTKKNGRLYDRNIEKSGYAHTMIGLKRMSNLVSCLDIIRKNNISGDLMECGVWRGGASIMMAAYNKQYKLGKRILVADSFNGLPKSTYKQDLNLDLSKDKFPQLAISVETVKDNFKKYHLLNDNIYFLKGWFKDTLPKIHKNLKLSLLRLDGDLFESTLDVLESMYDQVVPGGIIIVDDFGIRNCREAVFHFFESRKLEQPDFKKIDWTGIFWIKQ